jgi:Family of unknown function (DUF6535)
MQSSLNPIASDTTNSLLKILINKVDNTTFPAQEASLPVWTGPSSTIIWIQTLAYTSLSSSLLAAFGAVLGKQWLGHFKTTRFGGGALRERCQRRQQKLNALKASCFSTIIASLPIFLQLSLLFFGIALAANIWTLQHTVASVIMATTAFGFVFYSFTVVSSLKSPDSPFQTPVSTMLRRVLPDTAAFRQGVREKWTRRPRTWTGFLHGLRELSTHTVRTAMYLIATRSIRFGVYLSQLLLALRHKIRSLTHGPESPAAGSGQLDAKAASDQHATSSEDIDLGFLESSDMVNAVQSAAVQWILDISTDTDTIAVAASMVSEIEWLPNVDINHVRDRLKTHFYACFDPTQRILPLARAWAVALLKAMYHFHIERGLDNPLSISDYGPVLSTDDDNWYHIPPDQAFRVVHCAVACSIELDITPLPLSDRMWMAHMFTCRLDKDEEDPEFVTFVVNFIGTCLDSKSPARLIADCLLLAGMLVGLRIDRRHFARLDKR